MAAILDFRSEQFFALYDLQVTSMLPTKFRQLAFWFGWRSKKKKLSRWWPFWISDQNNFSYFCSTSLPDASYQVSSLFPFWFRRRSENRFSRWRPWRSSLCSGELISCGSPGFREDFFKFSHYKSMGANDPCGEANLDPRAWLAGFT